MEKPNKFRFKHAITTKCSSHKNHGKVFFRREDLQACLASAPAAATLVEVDHRSTYMSSDGYLEFSFYAKEDLSADEYRSQMIEYELHKKHQDTKALYNGKVQAAQALNKSISKSAELEGARKRLQEFVGNNKIPPEKKKELVSMWTDKVRLLELTINPADMELLNLLKQQITDLERDLQLQEEILNLNARNYEKVDCPSPACSCSYCREEYRHNDDDLWDD